MMLNMAGRAAYDADHDLFRDQVRKFFSVALMPHLDRWEADGIVDRAFWQACGDAGLLCPTIPPDYGGLGLDFGYNAVVGEELAYAGSAAGITLQDHRPDGPAPPRQSWPAAGGASSLRARGHGRRARTGPLRPKHQNREQAAWSSGKTLPGGWS
ncbi:acyl-CoA dehydrogenase family protein [Sphingobium yanoikuyae]|jgi:alkylation response protein AidB-like acyl-CoA dehydrogenase|uniref:acyl-CoA dehydrogenase family protein n=1 Tax=Sphingobium yanoikuyae TaxID=13690 RepID=UPI003B8FCE79